MKRCYLDSNVLVYFKDSNSLHFQTASRLISHLIPEKYELFLSSLTIDEFLHSLMFVYKFRRNINIEESESLETALMSILELEHIKIVNSSTSKENNLRVVKIMRDFRLGPRDAYHFLIMQENNIEYFATFDNDFKSVFKKKTLKKI